MMQDWNAYRAALLERASESAKLSPDTMQGLQLMDGAGASVLFGEGNGRPLGCRRPDLRQSDQSGRNRPRIDPAISKYL